MSVPNTPSPDRATADGAEGKNIPIEDVDATQGAAVSPGSSTEADAAVSEAKIIEEANAVLEGEPMEGAADQDVPAELEKARQEASEWQDKFLRLHAEWDTYRRRTTEQREAEKARATENLVSSLLPVIDDFERTIDYATKNGETGLLGGVEAVHAKLIDTLVKDGVVVIDPKGEAFDALEAQAVSTVDDTSVPDETVADVFQKGYKMGAKVLRPAMVTVACGGPKREKEEPSA